MSSKCLTGLDVCIANYCQDLRDKLANRKQIGGDLTAERTRHEALKADLAEIELAEKVGELIPVDLVIEKVGATLITVKSKLLAITPVNVQPDRGRSLSGKFELD